MPKPLNTLEKLKSYPQLDLDSRTEAVIILLQKGEYTNALKLFEKNIEYFPSLYTENEVLTKILLDKATNDKNFSFVNYQELLNWVSKFSIKFTDKLIKDLKVLDKKFASEVLELNLLETILKDLITQDVIFSQSDIRKISSSDSINLMKILTSTEDKKLNKTSTKTAIKENFDKGYLSKHFEKYKEEHPEELKKLPTSALEILKIYIPSASELLKDSIEISNTITEDKEEDILSVAGFLERLKLRQEHKDKQPDSTYPEQKEAPIEEAITIDRAPEPTHRYGLGDYVMEQLGALHNHD